jgi:hypothetical protein
MWDSADALTRIRTATRCGDEWSASHPLCFTARERGPDIYWMRGLGGSQRWSGQKYICACMVVLLAQTLVTVGSQPVCRSSLRQRQLLLRASRGFEYKNIYLIMRDFRLLPLYK